jgi:signal transduction histidine kinase
MKFSKFAIVCFLLFSTVALPTSGQGTVLKVGVFPAAPLVFVNDGKPTGLFIDLLEYFARKSGWKIEYVDGSWSDHVAGLARGVLDVLPAVGYTEARREVFDFNHVPIFIDSGVLFTKLRHDIHTIFDLEGLRVAGVQGSIFTAGFMDYLATFNIRCDLVLVSTNEEVMEAIVAGRVDAGVTIYSLGRDLQRRFKVQITPISFSPLALHFAVPKDKAGFILDAIDSEMEAMEGDSSSFYSKSFSKWAAGAKEGIIPSWLWWGMVGLGCLALFAWLWVFSLRREVRLKTKHLRTEIEERRYIDKQVRLLNRELEVKVDERTKQLQYANDELEAFTYSVAHDLRAPLRSIAGFAQILANPVKDPGDPSCTHCVERIVGNVEKMEDLIQGILGFSHVSKSDLHLSFVDMAGLARSVFDELVSAEEKAVIQFSVGDLPSCQADPMLMHQVWMNLIGNAIKYTRPKLLRRIEVSGRIEDGMCVYEVKDSGVGFDPEYSDKLFKLFQRLHSESEFEGTGVGLSIVARIISRHKGKVWATSVPAQGSTFSFSLPCPPENQKSSDRIPG